MQTSAKCPLSPTAQVAPVWERLPEWTAAQGSRPLAGPSLAASLSGRITLWKRTMHTCTQGLWALDPADELGVREPLAGLGERPEGPFGSGSIDNTPRLI